MIVTKYKDYFKTLTTYHQSSRELRPVMLKGYVSLVISQHPDESTRALLTQFKAREEQRLKA